MLLLNQDHILTTTPREVPSSSGRDKNGDIYDGSSLRPPVAPHTAKMKVAKLMDSYLSEVARDSKLPLSKFQALAEALPEFSRITDDGLYRAIDTYLKVEFCHNFFRSFLFQLCHLECVGLSEGAVLKFLNDFRTLLYLKTYLNFKLHFMASVPNFQGQLQKPLWHIIDNFKKGKAHVVMSILSKQDPSWKSLMESMLVWYTYR